MRKVRFIGEKSPANEHEAYAESAAYHEVVLTDPFVYHDLVDDFDGYVEVKKQMPVQMMREHGNTYLVSKAEEESPEKVRYVVELVRSAAARIARVVQNELGKSGILIDQANLEKQFLSAEDFTERVVVYFGKQKLWFGGKYDIANHRAIVVLQSFIDQDGRFSVNNFLKTLLHEYLHFSSFSDVDATEDGPDGGFMQSGYFGSRKHGNLEFHYFNEGVTDLMTLEMLLNFLNSMPLPSGPFELDESLTLAGAKSDSYYLQRLQVQQIISYLAQYQNVDEKTVWQGLKRGYFSGGVFEDESFVAMLEECFGNDVLENYFARLHEMSTIEPGTNIQADFDKRAPGWEGEAYALKHDQQHLLKFTLESLKKRWEKNGLKKIAQH